MYAFSDIVAYILIAWVLSMVGEPIMNFLDRRLRFKKFKAGKSVCAVLTLLFFILISTALVSVFVPLIAEQGEQLSQADYTSIANSLEEPINYINGWTEKLGVTTEGRTPEEQISNLLSGWFDPAYVSNLLSSLFSTASSLLIGVFSVFFIAFFFLREQGLFTSIIKAFAPERYGDQIVSAVDSVSRMLSRYFAGILIQITIITLFITIGLSIFGIKNALLIGFFAALINVIPYLGPLLGATFAVFITISSNLDLDFIAQVVPMITKVAIVFAAMQMLDNFLLQPYIFSNSVMAHPLEVFIVIMIGNSINGPVGMILAIPAYTVLRVMARTFFKEYGVVQKITKSLEG